MPANPAPGLCDQIRLAVSFCLHCRQSVYVPPPHPPTCLGVTCMHFSSTGRMYYCSVRTRVHAPIHPSYCLQCHGPAGSLIRHPAHMCYKQQASRFDENHYLPKGSWSCQAKYYSFRGRWCNRKASCCRAWGCVLCHLFVL